MERVWTAFPPPKPSQYYKMAHLTFQVVPTLGLKVTATKWHLQSCITTALWTQWVHCTLSIPLSTSISPSFRNNGEETSPQIIWCWMVRRKGCDVALFRISEKSKYGETVIRLCTSTSTIFFPPRIQYILVLIESVCLPCVLSVVDCVAPSPSYSFPVYTGILFHNSQSTLPSCFSLLYRISVLYLRLSHVIEII